MTHNRETSLKACAWCQGTKTGVLRNGDGWWSVFCETCEASAGWRQTKREAIEAWNTRTTPEAAPASPVKDEAERAFDDLRVAADVCELDENRIVAKQAVRIRAAAKALRAALSPVNGEVERLTDAEEARLVQAYKRGWDEGVETLIDDYCDTYLEAPHKDARGEGCGNFMQEVHAALASPETQSEGNVK